MEEKVARTTLHSIDDGMHGNTSSGTPSGTSPRSKSPQRSLLFRTYSSATCLHTPTDIIAHDHCRRQVSWLAAYYLRRLPRT